ncbi:MAG: hydroxymethylbilane synthase, partial [Candidatus Bathyarchaeia archaeon]
MMLTVGTRGSKLSLIQTEAVLKSLRALRPDVEFRVRVIKTIGDLNRKPLYSIGRKGIFEKEIDQALIRGEVDFAVHSLKDVPTIGSQDEIVLAAIPKRDSPLEALVSKDYATLDKLPKGAIVGTSSLRRMAQVKHLRPDIEVKPIRGNVDTRVRKVMQGEVDAIIIALAGLERLGLKNLAAEVFSPEIITPTAGQGALAVVTRRDRGDVIEILKAIDDSTTRAEVTAERSLISSIGGGCHFPIGSYAHAKGRKLSLYGCILSFDGKLKIEASAEADVEEAESLGRRV